MTSEPSSNSADDDQGASTERAQPVSATLSADISEQWSWAASNAHIPQISSFTVTTSDEIVHGRISITLRDGEEIFGSTELEGAIAAGTTEIDSVHVPLSARAMARVDERRALECVIELEDVATGLVLALIIREVDLQPRDLWYWDGDPRRGEGGAREDQNTVSSVLAESLLASFVRPNHPEIRLLGREAADRLPDDKAFYAFQLDDPDEVAAKVEVSISAIYDALRDRHIAYSDPPPGWDYRGSGQRIRDHGDVARAGLGTCMDTTALMAAVIEHVGLFPVLEHYS